MIIINLPVSLIFKIGGAGSEKLRGVIVLSSCLERSDGATGDEWGAAGRNRPTAVCNLLSHRSGSAIPAYLSLLQSCSAHRQRRTKACFIRKSMRQVKVV